MVIRPQKVSQALAILAFAGTLQLALNAPLQAAPPASPQGAGKKDDKAPLAGKAEANKADNDLIAKGKQLYQAKLCASCHGQVDHLEVPIMAVAKPLAGEKSNSKLASPDYIVETAEKIMNASQPLAEHPNYMTMQAILKGVKPTREDLQAIAAYIVDYRSHPEKYKK